MRPPIAPKRYGFRVRDIHGQHFDDPWDWLRDADDPEVIALLEAENAWADSVTSATRPLAEAIVGEVRAHTALTDASVPVRRGDHWYFSRTHEGSDYATHHRVPADASSDAQAPPLPEPGRPLPGEQLLIDENREAAGHEFFRLADLVPSPDGRLIASARDTRGDERYTWVVQDAQTGEVVDRAVVGAGYGLAWSADSRWFVYTGLDEAWRSCEVWAHRVGTGAPQDLLLLAEPDGAFDLVVAPSGFPGHVVIHSAASTTGGAWLWLPDCPTRLPIPLVGAAPGALIGVESAGDHLLVVHTATSAEGELAAAPLPPDGELASLAPEAGPGRSRAALGARDPGSQPGGAPDLEPIAPPSTWVALRSAGPGERIAHVEARASFLALTMRSGSLTQVEVRTRRAGAPRAERAGGAGGARWGADGAALRGAWEDAGRFVDAPGPVRTLSAEEGRYWDGMLRVEYQSQVLPPTTALVEPAFGALTPIKTQDAPGWDPNEFVEERVWVAARDGAVRIPVTLVHHRDARPDGTNPGWLTGYGAYEVSYDPEFDALRLPLLRRCVFAIAHVRGGGEMGRAWYEDGKGLAKEHTFTDFIDVAEWLASSGWVDPSRLVAEGRSAGGLLMGAVVNKAPDRFRAVLAGVPFVDALTTILDASLPLTVGEWQEWGDPITDPAVFAAMRAYTPYENVPEGVALPAVMATTSLNDTRVEFVEPAKWVQRLREAPGAAGRGDGQGPAGGRPVVLRTEMVAGHGGPSGREGRWAARAEEFAFALGQVGVAQ